LCSRIATSLIRLSAVYPDQVIIQADASLKNIYEKVAGAPLYISLADASAFAALTGEQVKLRHRDSNLGFRSLGDHNLFLHSLNTSMTKALDHRDKNGAITHNFFWNFLSRQLWVNSFDAAHGWRHVLEHMAKLWIDYCSGHLASFKSIRAVYMCIK
jgi:hypothetical protein